MYIYIYISFFLLSHRKSSSVRPVVGHRERKRIFRFIRFYPRESGHLCKRPLLSSLSPYNARFIRGYLRTCCSASAFFRHNCQNEVDAFLGLAFCSVHFLEPQRDELVSRYRRYSPFYVLTSPPLPPPPLRFFFRPFLASLVKLQFNIPTKVARSAFDSFPPFLLSSRFFSVPTIDSQAFSCSRSEV